MGDTDLCPWDMGTFGSRSMPDAALALGITAAGAREVLTTLAATGAGVSPKRPRSQGRSGAVAGSISKDPLRRARRRTRIE